MLNWAQISYTLLLDSHLTEPMCSKPLVLLQDSGRTVATRGSFSWLDSSKPQLLRKVRRVVQESTDCSLTSTVCSPAPWMETRCWIVLREKLRWIYLYKCASLYTDIFLKSCFSIKSQIHCPRGVQYLIKPYGESLHNVNNHLLTNFCCVCIFP